MNKSSSFLLILAILMTLPPAFAESQKEPVIDDGLYEARQSFFSGVGGAVRFRNLEPLFNTVNIGAGGNTWKLPYDKNQTLDELSFRHADKEYSLDEFLVSNRSNALLVLKNGKIVTELYRNGANENDLFMSFSTGKSITSTLIGMAVEDGYINSIDDQVGTIEVGKKADIILLDQNLFEIDPGEVYKTKVLATMFDGKIVHDVTFGIGDSEPADLSDLDITLERPILGQ